VFQEGLGMLSLIEAIERYSLLSTLPLILLLLGCSTSSHKNSSDSSANFDVTFELVNYSDTILGIELLVPESWKLMDQGNAVVFAERSKRAGVALLREQCFESDRARAISTDVGDFPSLLFSDPRGKRCYDYKQENNFSRVIYCDWKDATSKARMVHLMDYDLDVCLTFTGHRDATDMIQSKTNVFDRMVKSVKRLNN
jgi:hypothetical protein